MKRITYQLINRRRRRYTIKPLPRHLRYDLTPQGWVASFGGVS